LYLPGDHGYDEQRRPLSPAIDASGDGRQLLGGSTCGRHRGRSRILPIAVQATGHGPMCHQIWHPSQDCRDGSVRWTQTGRSPGRLWRAVSQVTPLRRVRSCPLSGSAPSVGVTGFTPGGGVGWLSRKCGFAADSVAREVVTADGRFVTASTDRHPDLFWARGGGANFGVAWRWSSGSTRSRTLAAFPVLRVDRGAE
jgi:hypothetical protein